MKDPDLPDLMTTFRTRHRPRRCRSHRWRIFRRRWDRISRQLGPYWNAVAMIPSEDSFDRIMKAIDADLEAAWTP